MRYPITPRNPNPIALSDDHDAVRVELEKFCLSPRQKRLVQDERIPPEARYAILVGSFRQNLTHTLSELEEMPPSRLTFSNYGVTSGGKPSLTISWKAESSDPKDRGFTHYNIANHARSKGAIEAGLSFSHEGYSDYVRSTRTQTDYER